MSDSRERYGEVTRADRELDRLGITARGRVSGNAELGLPRSRRRLASAQALGDALRAWTEAQERDGVVGWPAWEERVETIRGEVARLVNADRDEIAFIANTTQGISLIAEGFPWKEGDNVVTAADEFASNIYPWMNLASRGVGLRQVESRDGRIWLEDLAAAMDHATRVLAISHVEFATGFRNDLDALCEMCHARGVALFVDAIQGLGPLVIDVRRTPIDFLAADGHKWLLGPESAGLLYVRRDWIERLRPIGVGWHSVVGSYNSPRNEFHLKPGAQALGRRFVQHARLAVLRGERELVPRARRAGGLGPDHGPGGGRSRSGQGLRVGRLWFDAPP